MKPRQQHASTTAFDDGDEEGDEGEAEDEMKDGNKSQKKNKPYRTNNPAASTPSSPPSSSSSRWKSSFFARAMVLGNLFYWLKIYFNYYNYIYNNKFLI